MDEIKNELRYIEYYNSLSKSEKNLRLFLKMNYYNDKLIDYVIQHLKMCNDYEKDKNIFNF